MIGPVLGFFLGALLGGALSIAINAEDRRECEKHLTRTQHCVKTWTPDLQKQE